MTSFSVLLPVYQGDNPAHFERALQSVGADQTLPADEILVVCDGPVHADIDTLLGECSQAKRPDILGESSLKVVRLAKNQGLTAALNAGIEEATHPVIARADADDISLPERFARQIPLMDRYELLGSAIVEFEEDENELGMVRSMPLIGKDIRATVTYRDPFNHPTVVYRKEAVLKAGGYEHLDLMEDYLLFARMVHNGVSCANLPDALVKYRVGAGAYDRRGGRRLLRSELTLQRILRSEGVTTSYQFLRNVAIRGGYRLIPSSIRRIAYRSVGRMAWFRKTPSSGSS